MIIYLTNHSVHNFRVKRVEKYDASTKGASRKFLEMLLLIIATSYEI